MLVGFSHIAVGVRDLDLALVFYRDALGFEVRRDLVETWPARGVVPAMSRRAAYLQYVDYLDAPTSTFLVLDQQIGRDVGGGPAELGELGVNHFGLWVRDLDALISRASACGFTPVAEPRILQTSDTMGEAEGFFHRGIAYLDPDGNVVQVDERIPGPRE